MVDKPNEFVPEKCCGTSIVHAGGDVVCAICWVDCLYKNKKREEWTGTSEGKSTSIQSHYNNNNNNVTWTEV